MYEEYLKHVNLEVTDEIKKFVKNGVFGDSEYLFISKVDKANIAYCSMCENEFQTGSIKHNEGGICPSCGAKLVAKLVRYGRGNCKNEACFYYFEKSIVDPEILICKGYYVTKDYEIDYKNPQIEYELCAVYIFNEKPVMLRKDYWGKRWVLRNTVFDFNQGFLAPKMAYCSFDSIGKSIKDTRFRYMPYKKFKGHYSMVKLFNEFSKYPSIEYLVKEGFMGLVEDKLKGWPTYKTVKWSGKTIFDILRMNKLELREIKAKKVNINFRFLKIYQDAKKQSWGLSLEEIIKIAAEYTSHYDELKKMTGYASMKKLLKYFSKQYSKYNGTIKDSHYASESSVVNKFRDNIANCKILGMDISMEQILFPKDLYTTHQNTTKQIKIKEDKELDLKIMKREKELKKYNFQSGEYLIRPAKSSSDLINEGSTLNHCVASHYTIPYADGTTNILFIRKISEPDKPFCTIEVKNNEVKQAYIKDDKRPNKETLDFIEIFKREKLQSKKRNIKAPTQVNVSA